MVGSGMCLRFGLERWGKWSVDFRGYRRCGERGVLILS